jgi:hypothetical protein
LQAQEGLCQPIRTENRLRRVLWLGTHNSKGRL